MAAKQKPETIIKRQEARLQEAYTILSCQLLMELDKTFSEAMKERIQRFLKSFES